MIIKTKFLRPTKTKSPRIRVSFSYGAKPVTIDIGLYHGIETHIAAVVSAIQIADWSPDCEERPIEGVAACDIAGVVVIVNKFSRKGLSDWETQRKWNLRPGQASGMLNAVSKTHL